MKQIINFTLSAACLLGVVDPNGVCVPNADTELQRLELELMNEGIGGFNDRSLDQGSEFDRDLEDFISDETW